VRLVFLSQYKGEDEETPSEQYFSYVFRIPRNVFCQQKVAHGIGWRQGFETPL